MTNTMSASDGPIASLPMYETAENREAHGRFWQALSAYFRDCGIATPKHLTRGRCEDAGWLSEHLLISQTCGYPLTTSLKERVRYLGTPHYGVEGCEGPNYRSAIIARADDSRDNLEAFRGGIFAYNGENSQSGYHAMRAALTQRFAASSHLSQEPWFGKVKVTGSHFNSIIAVAGGQADIAAIDAVTYAMASRSLQPETETLKVIEWSPAAPGLPFITSLLKSSNEVEALSGALGRFINDSAHENLTRPLYLDGYSRLTLEDYAVIIRLKHQADMAGVVLFKPPAT